MELVCGPGVMTQWLAQKVGPTGHVYATDPLEPQVETTLRRLRKQNLTNVTCIHTPHTEIKLPDESLDLIFGRNSFVYACSPKKTMAGLYRLLKPGGTFIVDEPIVGTTQLCPPAPCIELFNQKVLELGRLQGAQYQIAPQLATLFRRVGFAITRHQFHTQRVSFKDTTETLYPQFIEQVGPAMLKHNIVTDEELAALRVELANLSGDIYTHGTLATHVRIVAVKPTT
jgi:ubiquinone/menaquinone biosynthesis C-methylase UbiE